MRDKRLNEALDKLADLFEYGHLQASTAPADFIDTVRLEIVKLRKMAHTPPQHTAAATGGEHNEGGEGVESEVDCN